ncbi:MAG: CoA transferase [Alphaproteobacteria bacterium]|nr:CoA transferase [Alphaproteobacteria bacterium]
MSLPLSGLRVITVEHYGAGPYGTGYLADLGADVIKIENRRTGGDMSRGIGPYHLGENDSQFFQSFNRNKRSLSLDLKHPRGREVLHRLAASADGLVDNLRGNQPAKLGLRYDDLKAANPRLVCTHLSAYGSEGERAGWPGYDFLMQAEAGFLDLTGEPDGPPARFGLSVVDFMTGITAMFALLAGITEARQSGQGRDLQVSLFDVAMHQLSYPAVWYLNEGLRTGRVARSGHPFVVPSQLYRTRDGWIFVMAQHQRFWETLCDKVGRPEWKADDRFKDYEGRHEHRDELTELLDEVLQQRDTAEWIELLAGAVPCGPVNDLAQALDSPFFRQHGGIQEVDHPDRPGLKLLNNPIRLGEPIPARPGPKLGADTGPILEELGYSAEEVAALRDDGAV